MKDKERQKQPQIKKTKKMRWLNSVWILDWILDPKKDMHEWENWQNSNKACRTINSITATLTFCRIL